MDDSHYPTVDYTFLKNLVESSGNIQKIVSIGSTTAYLFAGSSSISRRTVILRSPMDNQIDFNFAVSIAHRTKKLGELLVWLEKERNWKDGGYTTTDYTEN
jgi:hypothetical protein